MHIIYGCYPKRRRSLNYQIAMRQSHIYRQMDTMQLSI